MKVSAFLAAQRIVDGWGQLYNEDVGMENGKRQSHDIGAMETKEFLTDFAIRRKTTPFTQEQAFIADVTLYKLVLENRLDQERIIAVRAKSRDDVPVIDKKGHCLKSHY